MLNISISNLQHSLSYPVAEILCKLLPAFVNEPLPEKLNNDGPYHFTFD